MGERRASLSSVLSGCLEGARTSCKRAFEPSGSWTVTPECEARLTLRRSPWMTNGGLYVLPYQTDSDAPDPPAGSPHHRLRRNERAAGPARAHVASLFRRALYGTLERRLLLESALEQCLSVRRPMAKFHGERRCS